MLKIENLSASYGDSSVLDEVTFNIEEGDFFGILGANGAGKSTIIRAIAGLHPPTVTGRITYLGKDLLTEPAHARTGLGIAVVPEGRRMFSSLTVLDSLLMGAYKRGDSWQQRNLARILETFPELATRLNQPTGSMSGGQQQMVAFGRALMSEPRLLLLDEPSLGLAPVVVQRIFDLLAELHQQGNLTMILVEQNAIEAFPLLTRGCVIERGRVAFVGTRDELESSTVVKDAYFGTNDL
ncbi:ABC transporter ATP-binding protein [Pseudarthrobacter sp. NKDBFgelt]|uniref:ABC transporter ATP-binding protein n=1 Tax=Pseudarthrobacter sp. NKDBFgelt TaxID=3384443 RepID=UPI0038D4A399